MSQKSMIMNLILSGQITSDFYRLGSELSLMGELLDQIGSKVRDYQKDSLETYKNYETYMLEAKGALTAQYESQTELESVMQRLHGHAQEWAATTIFDTKDVAHAIAEAAHAGWTYEEMAEGIPQAMLLAQAGNLTLSDSLNYVIKALNATGTKFEDSDVLIDQWAMAANSGATNIGELGEAILRMGATARFNDSTAEMFTMLAVLADMGTVGSDAGTLLRNSMIRLIAPTEKANKAMAELGVTEAERLSTAADSEALAKANELLAQTGFSAYDAQGNLKPFLETYKDLYSSVSGMSEVDKNAVLSAIFPTRTITGALGLLEAASNSYDGLYEKILGSDGYAERIAQIQTSGLMGAEKAFESKNEEFSRKVGETLAPAKETLLDMFGAVIDFGNEMPEEALSGLVGAMTGIAVAGPALTAVGGALKLASALGPLGGGLLLASVGLGSFVGYATKLSELDLESTFGNLELDVEKLGGIVDSIETKFDVENSAVAQYAQALATAQENYVTLSSTLEENLLAASLTGHVLSDEEKANILGLGNDIGKAVLDGINAARDENLSFLDVLFGDAEEGTDEAKALEDAVDWTNGRFDSLYAEAENIGAQLRASMVAALMDGELNAQEQAAIDASIARMNQIQAEIASRMERQDYLTQLRKAQSISWDSLGEYLEDNAQKQADQLLAADELYFSQWGQLRESWEHEYAQATSDAQRRELEAEWANLDEQLLYEYEASKKGIQEKFGDLAYEAFGAAMRGSDHGQAWAFLEKLWENEMPVFDNGVWDFGNKDFSEYLPTGVSAEDMEDQLNKLWQGEHGWTGLGNKYSEVMEPYIGSQASDMLDSALNITVKPIIDDSGLDAMMGGETAELEASVSGDTAELEAAIAEQDGVNLVSYVDGDTDALESAIDEQDRRDLVANVDGDTSALRAAIEACDGMSISVKVRGSLSGLGGGSSSSSSKSSSSSSNSGRWVSKLYAEGGRATEASIFGEAGPEWAIPEEHSSRTAGLLDQARRASGFTWGDLIGRNGGLNGTPGSKTVNLTYAPTINAGNADGVERALASDKNRLMAMMRSMMDEMNMRDDAEVYA